TPLANRSEARLLALNKQTGDISHQQFSSFIDYLKPGDLLVLNNTKVIPARLFGVKEDTKAKVELLLLKSRGQDEWEVLAKPAKRVKKGSILQFGEDAQSLPLLTAEILDEQDMGGRTIKFSYTGIFHEILDLLGHMPLPPYVKEQLEDKNRYQTVYAKHEGSAAAPTAGLHFTEDYLKRIADKGIQLAYITLHVGLGTFRPVSVEQVEEHRMHAEYYEVSAKTAELINRTYQAGNRIVAVGTTSVRTLETLAQRFGAGKLEACQGWTDIFVYPGYEFQLVQAMLTNFHLPKSTLLMLISALAGRERILHAYKQAVKQQYRFFSFGDAMFIY
ncbi:MAG: tRNA preQ1(34) S-adenosylmethionine ribosyltransferase-isomerase QueA, partial [Paenibacillus sp. RIFOXYA1_FULL_44_5]